MSGHPAAVPAGGGAADQGSEAEVCRHGLLHPEENEGTERSVDRRRKRRKRRRKGKKRRKKRKRRIKR